MSKDIPINIYFTRHSFVICMICFLCISKFIQVYIAASVSADNTRKYVWKAVEFWHDMHLFMYLELPAHVLNFTIQSHAPDRKTWVIVCAVDANTWKTLNFSTIKASILSSFQMLSSVTMTTQPAFEIFVDQTLWP